MPELSTPSPTDIWILQLGRHAFFDKLIIGIYDSTAGKRILLPPKKG